MDQLRVDASTLTKEESEVNLTARMLDSVMECPMITREEDSPRREEDFDARSVEHFHATATAANTGTIPNLHKSLAWAHTTPRIARWFIPIMALLTHGLFLYGQIEPMWRLTTFYSINTWWNATSTTSKWAYDTLGLPHELNLILEQHQDSPSNSRKISIQPNTETGTTIQTFTYSFAITELWAAAGMPGKLLPRIAAILLTLFSGIWPHLKLILLQITWMTRLPSPHRKRSLNWLSSLGKWSLADILVVCVMVGVLHLDWNVNPEEIRLGIANHLPQMLKLVQSQYNSTSLCTNLLTYDCAHFDSVTHRVKCDACITAVNAAFWKADWTESTGKNILNGIATSGDGVCQLRVVGMRGIYAFCVAVILSILLSLIVDVLDHQYCKSTVTARLQEQSQLQESLLPLDSLTLHSPSMHFDEEREGGHGGAAMSNNYALIESDCEAADEDSPFLQGAVRSTLSLEPVSELHDEHDDPTIVQVPIRWFLCTHAVFSIAVLLLSIFATSFITFERHIHGAIPMLLHDILGVEWSQLYSLSTLSVMTGSAGGWDLLLMTTFSLFCVVGPVLRSALSVVGHILLQIFGPGDVCQLISMVQGLMSFVGAFCAWEVFVIAVTMIGLLMPSITNTILMDSRCQEVDPSGTCFQVEFQVLPSFASVLVAGVLLVVISNTFFFFSKGRARRYQQ